MADVGGHTHVQDKIPMHSRHRISVSTEGKRPEEAAKEGGTKVEDGSFVSSQPAEKQNGRTQKSHKKPHEKPHEMEWFPVR